MPSNSQTFRLVFDGGWATDYGDNAEVGISQDGMVQIPFLTESLNNYYHLDGATHKIGGTTKMNATVANSGAKIIGLFDYWKGAGGSSTQKICIHTGTTFQVASMDGTFAEPTGAVVLTDDTPVSYNTFDDLLIIGSVADVPKSYDQSVVQTLAGSPPNFAFSETHKNRVWAAGVAALPSRLYYSTHVDPENWTGAGSGFIDIDPADGDGIMAIASHKDNLWVFKGPYTGSIHRIIGSAPTGSDSFGRQTFVNGIGAVGQNTLFRFKDDLGFMWSDGSIHSLAATAAYGDFNEAALSRPINGWILPRVNAGRLKYAWAATDSVRGYVLFTLPINSSTTNNVHLMMDYRFDTPRWSRWEAFDSGAVASVVNSGIPQIFSAGNDGFVRKTQRSARSIDTTTPYEAKTTTPFISFGTPHNMKVLSRTSLGVNPIGPYNVKFEWTRDNNATQTVSTSQGGSGTAFGDPFLLGTSRLGGSAFQHRFIALEEGGEFRTLQLNASNSLLNEDLELHVIGLTIARGADSGEN